MTISVSDPQALYRARLEAHLSEVRAADGLDGRFGLFRVLIFGLVVAIGILAATGALSWWLLLVPLGLFFAVVVMHGRMRQRRRLAERKVELFERGLARIEDRWAGEGATGIPYRPEHHVYADDLDLFGEGSLFQLLCSARTKAGEACLAAWLLGPAPPATVLARQDAVDALRDRVDLREDFALAGEEVGSALDRGVATSWVSAPLELVGRWLPVVLLPIGIVTATSGLGWAFGGWPVLPFLVAAVVQFALTLPYRARVDKVLAEADRPSQDLALVARLLRRFEAEAFTEGRLGELRRVLEEDGASPSREIARLVRLTDFVDARRNQIFLPISWLLGLGTQLAFAIERWRRDHGRALVQWLDALGELEALLSISAYAFEHPADPFPIFVEGVARIEGEALGHPLMADATNIRNDIGLAAEPGAVQACLVSGSNMSGKSTWLRTVGVNTVLAQAGAPVRAHKLRLSPLRIGASIRVNDSLREGASRFYAEIQRLHEVVDAARGAVHVLFLLDEMLGGTNSHDRRIGAEAVIRTLLRRGAIGFVTTHDLALAEVADLEPSMVNMHFEDRLEGDRMVFDYRIRPGVVTHSNAIALMRAVGIEV